MLAGGHQEQVSRLLQALDCKIQLPEKWANTFFKESGMQPTSYDERRRFVRFNLRVKGLLRIRPTLPAIQRGNETHVVYTCNVSRSGFGFLHAEQLYPCEVCELWLPTQKSVIEVVQCRYICDNCYMIGARPVNNAVVAVPAG